MAFTQILQQVLSIGYNPWISCPVENRKEKGYQIAVPMKG